MAERKPERNAIIRQQRAEGWKLEAIAAFHGIARTGVQAVLDPARNRKKGLRYKAERRRQRLAAGGPAPRYVYALAVLDVIGEAAAEELRARRAAVVPVEVTGEMVSDWWATSGKTADARSSWSAGVAALRLDRGGDRG